MHRMSVRELIGELRKCPDGDAYVVLDLLSERRKMSPENAQPPFEMNYLDDVEFRSGVIRLILGEGGYW